jgi:hypothetical protein
VAAAAAVIDSEEPRRLRVGDTEAQPEGEEQQHLGESLSSLTATAASSRGTVVATTTPALTIPLVQATPITVSQIHQEERVVQLEQRNAELQAALEEQREQQQEEALAPGFCTAVASHAVVYWSKLSKPQKCFRLFVSFMCVLLIIATAVLVDQKKKRRWRLPPAMLLPPSILDLLVDSENHTIWRTLIETSDDNSLVDVFHDSSVVYQYVFAPTDAAVMQHQVPVQQLLTAEWRQHRQCFVLSHIVTTQVDDPAATSEINIDFIEEVNGTWTSQEEWLTLWPEFTVTIQSVYNTDPYYIGPYNIGSFWVNGIPFFMADIYTPPPPTGGSTTFTCCTKGRSRHLASASHCGR